jgi:hypothetical protein
MQHATCNFAFCMLLKPRLQARGKMQHATCNFAFCMLLKPRLQARDKRQHATCNFAFCMLLQPRLQARGKMQEVTCNMQHATLPFACCLNQGLLSKYTFETLFLTSFLKCFLGNRSEVILHHF